MELKGFSKYEVYPEEGKIWSKKRKKFIGYKNKTKGYWECTMFDDNDVEKRFYLHRVIWETIFGEIPKDVEINHVDENKDNNCISNLNLLTRTENVNWGTRNERTSKALSKPLVALKDGNINLYFKSLKETETIGFSSGFICDCIHKHYDTAYGYQWQYVDDYLADWWEQEMEKAV